MDKNKKNLITKYLDGELNGDELAEVRRLVLEDEAFNERLMIRKSLKEVDETLNQIEQEEELDKLLDEHEAQKEKVPLKIKHLPYYIITGIAAIMVVGIYIWYNNKPIDELTLDIDYYQVNFKGGRGFNSSMDNRKPTFVKKTQIYFESNKSVLDTTYIISSDTLKIIVPQINKELNLQKVALTFDYAIKKLLLTIDKDTFEIKNSSQKEKLVRFKR